MADRKEETDETTTESSNPASPVIDLDTPPVSIEPVPEKTVEQGILDTRLEMAGLPVIERIEYVKGKTAEHARCGLLISEECRLKMKEHRANVDRMLKRTKSLYNELNTVQHYIQSSLKKTNELREDLEKHLQVHDATYSKIKQRDGHLDFVLKLMDVTATDMRDTWTTLTDDVARLTAENRMLREKNYKLKGNFFRKREADLIDTSNEVEFVAQYMPTKKPKLEVDLTEDVVISKKEDVVLDPLTAEDKKAITILTPLAFPTLDDSTTTDTLTTDKDLKPEPKDTKPFEFCNQPKGWIDDDKKLDDEPRTELEARQIAMLEALKAQQATDAASSKDNEPKAETSRSNEPLKATTSKNVDLGDDYTRKASKELERQRQVASEIAKKKELAVRQSESKRTSSRERRERKASEEFEKAAPQTLFARKVSDGFEVRYLTANLMEFRERVPRYLDSDWPQLTPTMLQDLLPSPICVRFVYGEGLHRRGKMDTVHIDHQCPRSHITYQMLEKATRKKLGQPINFKLHWGMCREFTCETYIDTVFLDPPTRRMKFPIRLCVVDDESYDRRRITLGYDFISKYVHSMKGPFEEGDILLGDNTGHWWATTYQKKVKFT